MECGAIAEVDPCLALVCRVLTVLTVLNHTHTRAAPRVRTQQSRNVWLATARRRIGPVQLSRVGLVAAGRTVPRRRCECACGSIDRAGQAWWRRQAVPPAVATSKQTCGGHHATCNATYSASLQRRRLDVDGSDTQVLTHTLRCAHSALPNTCRPNTCMPKACMPKACMRHATCNCQRSVSPHTLPRARRSIVSVM